MRNDRSLLDIGSYKTVLIVDEHGNANVLRTALEAEGFEPIIATNAGEARVLTRTREPAFVLTELVLPRETGFELCAYLKHRNDTLPVIILTEVDLDAARNLAIWSGADAYLTKPTDAKTIAEMLHEIATIMALRVRKQTNVEGRIEFKCNRCGKSLSVKPENAGRVVPCKGCGQLAKAPTMNMQSGGFWRQTEEEAETEKKGQSDEDGPKNRANFYCDLCGQMLDVFGAREDGKVKCQGCHKSHSIPRWVIRQRKFFFNRPTDSATQQLTFNPARYVTVRCGECQTRFQVFRDRGGGGKATCPHCHAEQSSVSIKGSPLSRAALTSTGRMFVMKAGTHKGKRFLVPEDGEVVLGSGKKCNLKVPAQEGVAPRHAALRHVNEMVAVLPLDGPVLVNDEPIAQHRHWLKAGDRVTLGPIQLQLLGNADLSENQLLKKSSKAADADSADQFAGKTEIAEQSANILQLHWERLRKKPEPLPEDPTPTKPARQPKSPPSTPKKTSPAQPPVTGNGEAIGATPEAPELKTEASPGPSTGPNPSTPSSPSGQGSDFSIDSLKML